jgi:Ca2+-binding RTX toxin-like protein
MSGFISAQESQALLDAAKAKYGGTDSNGNRKYRYDEDGTGTDMNGDGIPEISCSQMVYKALKDAELPVQYLSARGDKQGRGLNSNWADRFYGQVDISDVRPGDLIVFRAHVGLVESVYYDTSIGKYRGTFFHSEGYSGGPTTTGFILDPRSQRPGYVDNYYGDNEPITRFLRPKSPEPGGTYPPLTPSGNLVWPDGTIPVQSSESRRSDASALDSLLSIFVSNAEAADTAPAPVCPLILDLDRDGIETTAVTDGAYFDHDKNGFAEQTGWASPDDGILVRDINGNGIIDNGGELFGDHTLLQNGQTAANGFAVLAQFDQNNDFKIDSSDTAIWSQLKIWQDIDGDGYSSPDELFTLREEGIASINTGYTPSTYVDANGNEHREVGTFTRTDSTTGTATDVWFKTNNAYTIADEWLDDTAVAALPDLQGYGNVYDLHQAMVRGGSGSGSLQDLVGQFVLATDAATRNALDTNGYDLTDRIILKWTGADGVAAGSRGPSFDAKKLATIETLFGQAFEGIDHSPNPNDNAAIYLNKAYHGLHEMFYAELAAQTFEKSLYDTISYTWDDASESIKGDLTQVAATLHGELSNSSMYEAGKVDLSEFVRTLRGLDAQGMMNFYDFRSQVTGGDESLSWIVDSVGQQYFLYGNDTGQTLSGANIPSEWGMGGNTVSELAMYGGAGNDNVEGGCSNDVLYGGAGNDYLWGGGGGDDTLNGGADADTLDAQNGNDMLYGGAGNDTLQGGPGNDYLDGGAGDDLLKGQAGDDTYVWGTNAGNDIIDQTGNDGSDTLQLGGTLTPDSFDYTSTGSAWSYGYDGGGDLVMKAKDTGETLTFKRWLADSTVRVQSVHFGDGTELTSSQIAERIIVQPVGTSGNDTINNGYDGYRMVVDGLAGNDTIYGKNMDDILRGGDGSDTVSGDAGNDTLYGDAGNDSLQGGSGNDFLDGGLGNDTLSGGAGNDIYVWGTGAGNDIISQGSNEGNDVLQLGAGLTPDSFDYQGQNTGTFVLKINSTGETLTMPNWLSDPSKRISTFHFADGTDLTSAQVDARIPITVTGTSGNDSLDSNNDNYKATL